MQFLFENTYLYSFNLHENDIECHEKFYKFHFFVSDLLTAVTKNIFDMSIHNKSSEVCMSIHFYLRISFSLSGKKFAYAS